MRKIILEFLIGCLLSGTCFVCFCILNILFESLDIEMFFGGDQASLFCGLFLGVPIGALVGISLVDKLIFKSQGSHMIGILVGFILGEFGVVLGIWLLDQIGVRAIFLIPFMVTCLSLIGYNIIR